VYHQSLDAPPPPESPPPKLPPPESPPPYELPDEYELEEELYEEEDEDELLVGRDEGLELEGVYEAVYFGV
jgi:hypothetical protein